MMVDEQVFPRQGRLTMSDVVETVVGPLRKDSHDNMLNLEARCERLGAPTPHPSTLVHGQRHVVQGVPSASGRRRDDGDQLLAAKKPRQTRPASAQPSALGEPSQAAIRCIAPAPRILEVQVDDI